MDLKGQFTGLGFINPLNGAVFDPVTLTTIFTGMSAGTAATIGSIATIAGPVLGMVGTGMQISQENKRLDQQAAEHDRAAMEQRVSSNIEAERFRRRSRVSQSADRARMAEGGVASGTGLDLLSQNETMMELDALMLEYQGEQAATGQEFAAGQSRSSKGGYLPVLTSGIKGFTNMDPLNLSPSGGTQGPRIYGAENKDG